MNLEPSSLLEPSFPLEPWNDFNRDVYCLFGLPVDNQTLAGTKAWLRERAGQKESSAILSTININWVAEALRDPEFRDAILNSDLVTLDGRPLLWLARLLGFPMTEVVAGSTLIDELNREQTDQPLSIFFFGGEEEAGRLAMERVNSSKGGLRAVGWLNPGFGSVEEMSRPEIIEAINRTRPDLLLVALGAKKGTRWIEHNRHRLDARVISHLGATINFMAGTVQRAPVPARNLGLEWAWRILQEPKLFFRYAQDGLLILRRLARLFPLWIRYRAWQKDFRHEPADPAIERLENDQEVTLSFGRNLRVAEGSPVRERFGRDAAAGKDITLNFQGTEVANGVFPGLLLVLAKHQQRSGRRLRLINVHGRLAKIFILLGIPNELGGTGNQP